MIFSSPGTAKTPVPFLPTALSICFESESKTDATCLRESAVDSAILVRISLLVADFAVVAIALLSLAKRLEIPFTRAEVCMKQGDFASLSWFRARFFLQNMQNHREFRLQQNEAGHNPLQINGHCGAGDCRVFCRKYAILPSIPEKLASPKTPASRRRDEIQDGHFAWRNGTNKCGHI